MAAAYEQFCREIIDVVAPFVPAVKPQAAFFEQLGPPGMAALEKVIRYARQNELLVIVDGKRNDIGSTATAYAQGFLGSQSPWHGDALTVSPYLGDDSLQPFVDVAVRHDAGVFVLVKTSNPGGGCSKTSWPTAARSTGTWPNMSRRLAADRRPVRLRGRRRGGRSYVSGPASRASQRRCRIAGFSCPDSGPRAEQRPTWPGPFDRRMERGRSSTIPAASSSPISCAPYAERFGAGPMARGGRSGHARHDRAASGRHAGRKAVTMILLPPGDGDGFF